jgi:hypothetical protein
MWQLPRPVPPTMSPNDPTRATPVCPLPAAPDLSGVAVVAPQHVSECHQAGAVPGYVDYAVHRGATLKVDIEAGRFVFFYRPVDF